MITTVNAAFDEFMTHYVNLDSSITATARTSRDWLLKQLHFLPSNHNDFPLLYSDVDIHYGSFARRTKIRELNDIDLIVGINALGTTYLNDGGSIKLIVPEGIALRKLCHDGTSFLNSRLLINKFVKHLEDVPQYSKAEIKRNGVAAVLNLISYTWVFDIVPGFLTTPEFDNRTYYIIPDGNGHWMKTDPRIDQKRVTDINHAHGGNILNVVRLIKYWNRRSMMPTISSYLLECMVFAYYENQIRKASSYVDTELRYILTHLANAVYGAVQDPKNIQGDINTLSWNDRQAISLRAVSDVIKAAEAGSAESAGDHELSIKLWGEIFGPAFPKYGQLELP